jgi:beta-galactosidase
MKIPSIAITYHSEHGHTKQAAVMLQRFLEAKELLVHNVPVEEAETHWQQLHNADAIIFGCPTLFGNVSATFKAFMEKTGAFWYKQLWKDKLAAGFTVSSTVSGDKLHTLRFFLDEMHKRGIKAILGTCSYIPPQWLVANHPEALWQYEDGHYAHPMGRHSMSRNHPLFRKELEKFLIAYATAFKDHPAVIGWQLDNEIEHNINFRVDYNAVNKKSWTEWLHKTYKTTDELNRRLGLKAWGLQTDAIKNIWMPSKSNDGDLPILRLTMLHFQKDDIMEYFRWQKAILQRVGIEDWITTDWIMINHTIADEPEKTNPIDISGINQYQPTNNDPKYWAYQAFMNDLHRSVNGNGKFLVTETRIGVTGSEKIWTPAPSHQQFMTWMMQPAAFGASGLMHWSANRYTGGHWPHWGGILDWSENPEPDFQWTTEIAAFYKKWGKKLISEPVKSTAAVLTDFDQRATLRIYTHTPSAISSDLLTEAFDAFHRNGIGVDALNTVTAADYENLKKYQILVIASAVCLDEQKLLPALTKFVQNGGLLIVTPFTGYQTWDGLFKKTGFAAGLNDLTGTAVQTVRLLQEGGTGQTTVTWKVWSKGSSVVGMEGFTEILNVKGSILHPKHLLLPSLILPFHIAPFEYMQT